MDPVSHAVQLVGSPLHSRQLPSHAIRIKLSENQFWNLLRQIGPVEVMAVANDGVELKVPGEHGHTPPFRGNEMVSVSSTHSVQVNGSLQTEQVSGHSNKV